MNKDEKGVSINVPYKLEKLVLESGDTKMFARMENARYVRTRQVERILSALKRGEHFGAPLVLNRVDGKLRVIDGNHRLHALVEFLTGTKNKVAVEAAVYDGLTREEEILVYAQWNSGVKQSNNDRIQVMREEIPIVQMLCEEGSSFPCKVHIYPPTAGMKGLSLRPLLNAYYHSRHPFGSNQGNTRRAGHNGVAEWAKTLGQGEYQWMYDYVKFFEQCFGRLERSNPFCAPAFFEAFARVYHMNVKTFGRKEMIDACHRHLLGHAHVINLALMARGHRGLTALAQVICDQLNKGKRKTSSWLCDWRLPQDLRPGSHQAEVDAVSAYTSNAASGRPLPFTTGAGI